MSHVLVTGAGGYIGVNVVEALLRLGHEVTAVALHPDRINPQAKVVTRDIFDIQGDAYEALGRPDSCIHLAWKDGFNHSSDAHIDNLSNHYHFLANLMEGGLKCLAVMGTMHEVGYHEGAITEDTPINPLNPYGIAKNALRQLVEVKAKTCGCTLQWIRAYYIFGQDQFSNSVFAKIHAAALRGDKTFPFTTGCNEYDFISVEDLGLEIALASTQRNVAGIINCCSGKPMPLRSAVERYIRDNGFEIELNVGAFPDRPYDSPCVYGDSSKIVEIVDRYLQEDGFSGRCRQEAEELLAKLR